MEITLELINNELIKIDQTINNIYAYPYKLGLAKEKILEDMLNRRDNLLFERDKVLKINK